MRPLQVHLLGQRCGQAVPPDHPEPAHPVPGGVLPGSSPTPAKDLVEYLGDCAALADAVAPAHLPALAAEQVLDEQAEGERELYLVEFPEGIQGKTLEMP